MGRQVFTAGEILTAANMNDLGDQTVMVFDDATARTTAIPTPVEGMVTYLKDTDEVDKFDGTAFVPVGIAPAILQVLSTAKTDTFTTTSTTYTEVTGLSVSITPTSSTNKILISVSLGMLDASAVAALIFQFVRNGTPIAIGDSDGNRTPGTFATVRSNSERGDAGATVSFLDSPETTSATTYQLEARTESGLLSINRRAGDSDAANRPLTISTITVMEVAG